VAVFLPIWVVLASLVVAIAIVVGLMLAFTATIRTAPSGFSVARSTLEWAYVGATTPLDKAEVRKRLGPDADPRAFVMYRSYVTRRSRSRSTTGRPPPVLAGVDA